MSVDVVLEEVSSGISGFAFDLSVQDPAVAEIQSVTLPAYGIELVSGAPGSTIRVIVADVEELLQGQITSVVIATANVDLLSVGTTPLNITLIQLDSDTPASDLVPVTLIVPGSVTAN